MEAIVLKRQEQTMIYFPFLVSDRDNFITYYIGTATKRNSHSLDVKLRIVGWQNAQAGNIGQRVCSVKTIKVDIFITKKSKRTFMLY